MLAPSNVWAHDDTARMSRPTRAVVASTPSSGQSLSCSVAERLEPANSTFGTGADSRTDCW